MTMTALVMAARRPDEANPIAISEGVSHKCLIAIGGRPMLERVAFCLAESPGIGEILVSLDDPKVLDAVPALAPLRASGRLRAVPAGGNLFESVRLGLDGAAWPALVTTADNALMTPEMIGRFLADWAETDAEVGVAVTRAETVWAKYPDGQRRPHRFRDGPISNCNIFALRSPAALRAARAFEGGGQFGKSKLRVLQAFGPINLLLYLSKMLTRAQVFARISRVFRVKVVALELPFAEAPIDVDNERTLRIAREIVALRQASGEEPPAGPKAAADLSGA